MSKYNLESRLQSTKDFIKSHKTSSFLAGMALYGANIYLGYYKVADELSQGNYRRAAVSYGLSFIPQIPGTLLLGFSSFYLAKQVLGRKRAAKTFRYLSKPLARRKR